MIVIAGGGGGVAIGGRDVLPFPKWLARQLGYKVSGGSSLTSIARLKATNKKIPRDQRKLWSKLADSIKPARGGSKANQIKQLFRRGAKGGIGAAAILELLIAMYCADQCS
jgi:hypothetical protein